MLESRCCTCSGSAQLITDIKSWFIAITSFSIWDSSWCLFIAGEQRSRLRHDSLASSKKGFVGERAAAWKCPFLSLDYDQLGWRRHHCPISYESAKAMIGWSRYQPLWHLFSECNLALFPLRPRESQSGFSTVASASCMPSTCSLGFAVSGWMCNRTQPKWRSLSWLDSLILKYSCLSSSSLCMSWVMGNLCIIVLVSM